mgnify:CR=1 FL=1
MEEESLVRRLQRKDPAALEALMDRDMSFACGIASSILRGAPRDVEEVVSDSFLALWDNAPKLIPGRVRGYLGTIVRNKAKNRLRELGRELPLEADLLNLKPSPVPGPDESLELEERTALVEQLLRSLPQLDRTIFLRHYYYGQTVYQIGTALSMNPSTIKVRLHRGRKKLKELLKKRGYLCEISDL